MSKKILIVTEYFYPEEFKINEVALSFQEKGYIVDILTLNPTYPYGKVFDKYNNKWFTKDSYNGMNIYRLKSVTGYKSSLFKKLLKYFSFMILGSFVTLKIGKKYDYILGFDIGALSSMLPAVLIKKFYKKRVILWVQDIWPDSVYAYGFKKTKILEYILNKFVRFIYRHTDAFAVTGEGFKEKILPYIDNNQPIKYIPNWADDFNKNLEEFSFSDNKVTNFTFAGNIGKLQNLNNVIEAFGNLSRKYQQNAQLNIIGDGTELESLKQIVKENNYKNIIFWGRKPKDEMYKYLKASDFLIVSLIDNPILELTIPAKVQTYIASGKPILAILNGDTADIIKDNSLGYCASPNDINEIKYIFQKAIDTSSKELEKFTKNCEILTNTIFSKEIILDNIINMMENK